VFLLARLVSPWSCPLPSELPLPCMDLIKHRSRLRRGLLFSNSKVSTLHDQQASTLGSKAGKPKQWLLPEQDHVSPSVAGQGQIHHPAA